MHLIAGLPRSGSTLLANILAQNPRFQIGSTSGLVDVLVNVRNAWDQQEEHKAMRPEDSEQGKIRVLRQIVVGYHRFEFFTTDGGQKRKTLFDRARGWLGHLEMIERLNAGQPLKIIVPIRDLRDILASLESLWRNLSATRQIPWEARNYLGFQSLHGRCAAWMAPDGILGIAYNRLKDAAGRGFSHRMHLVRFEELTTNPRSTLDALHSYLGEPFFDYDFADVKTLIHENDYAYGMPTLHEIRPVVESVPSRWREVLGEVGNIYSPLNYFLGYGTG